MESPDSAKLLSFGVLGVLLIGFSVKIATMYSSYVFLCNEIALMYFAGIGFVAISLSPRVLPLAYGLFAIATLFVPTSIFYTTAGDFFRASYALILLMVAFVASFSIYRLFRKKHTPRYNKSVERTRTGGDVE